MPSLRKKSIIHDLFSEHELVSVDELSALGREVPWVLIPSCYITLSQT